MNEKPYIPSDDGPTRISVVVMEDQPVIRAGILHLLSGTEFDVVNEADSTESLYAIIEASLPKILLGEVTLRGESVYHAISRLRLMHPGMGILFYSASDNPVDEAQAISVGANGYVYRSDGRESLLVALRRVANGESLWTGADQRRLSSYLRDGRPKAGGFAPLTPRENEILRMVTTGATNRDISAALGISHETVKEHVQHLLKKLGVNDRTQAAVWAVRHGVV